jgi:23S rRNA pseudouridine2457 synthase
VHKILHYYKIYKPYGVLSQFTDTSGRPTLKELFEFPQDVYPVGRLDADSEGLLLLTNDTSFNQFLLNPASKTEKEYLVQVEGVPGEKDIEKLKRGVLIEGKKTLPAIVDITDTPILPPRVPPIRMRKTIPDSWLRIIITEGRNRQVRKMTAHIGFPALRLVRVRIKNITIEGFNPGETAELSIDELQQLKSIH